MNLSASPVAGVGGLGLVILASLITVDMPATWCVLLASAVSGSALGVLIIAMHEKAHGFSGVAVDPRALNVQARQLCSRSM